MKLVEHMRRSTEAWVKKDLQELKAKLTQALVDGLALRPSVRAKSRGSGGSSGPGANKSKSCRLVGLKSLQVNETRLWWLVPISECMLEVGICI